MTLMVFHENEGRNIFLDLTGDVAKNTTSVIRQELNPLLCNSALTTKQRRTLLVGKGINHVGYLGKLSSEFRTRRIILLPGKRSMI